MNIFEWIAEEQIIRAIADGQFDNLKGRGKPLYLTQDDLIPEDTRLAYHILKNNGYTLPWIELQQEIQSSLAAARCTFRISYLHSRAAVTRQRALDQFAGDITRINQKIMLYNLQVPRTDLQYFPLRVDNEIINCINELNKNTCLEGNS